MTFITWSFSLFIKNHVMVNVYVFSEVIVVFKCEWHFRQDKKLWMTFNTWTYLLFIKKIMLWSTCMCFLKSLWSSTLNDIHHMKFFAIHKRSCYGHMNHMNFFAIHKKSCYGQGACVFSSRWGLQLWMTFITWSFSLFIKNHVMVTWIAWIFSFS